MSIIIFLSGCGTNIDVLDNSYIIIGATLYLCQDGFTINSWQLTGETVKQLEKSARKQAHLHSNTKIYYDDNCVFDPEKTAKMGQLCYIQHDSGKHRKGAFCDAAQCMVRGI